MNPKPGTYHQINNHHETLATISVNMVRASDMLLLWHLARVGQALSLLRPTLLRAPDVTAKNGQHSMIADRIDPDDIDTVQAATTSESGKRRQLLLQSLFSLSSSSLLVVTPEASASETVQNVLVPLVYVPSLSAYVVRYQVEGDSFGAILDTGSPFLTVPGTHCGTAPSKYGCYRPQLGRPSGLSNTLERFDNNQGEVEWRLAPFAFVNATGSMIIPELTFGVLSESLMDGPGGVFLGLVKTTDNWIRPSFLGQTPVRAFQVDLREEKLLRLSTTLLVTGDFIPLVTDLRDFGDPTLHYTARASRVVANGTPLGQDRQPIYVIFDTGITGMVVSPELLHERYRTARANRERNLWGTVEVEFRTKQGKSITLSATKPVTTPLGEMPWPRFRNAHLIAIGLSFLDERRMTIDIDTLKLAVD